MKDKNDLKLLVLIGWYIQKNYNKKENGYLHILLCTTKAPCEVAFMGERHVRIEISDFVMRTFVLE